MEAIKNRFLKLISSEIFKNTGVLVSGTVLAQLIPITLQIFLRRIYTPEIFGAFSVYLSIVNISIYFFTYRYELAVVNPKKDKDAINIFALLWSISTIAGIVLFVLMLFFKERFAELINFPQKYSFLLYILPITVMFYAYYQAIQYWLIRKKAFKSISLNKIVRRSGEGIVQFSFGYLIKKIGLVVGDLTGMILNVVFGFFQSKKNGLKFKEVDKKTMFKVAKEYREYPLTNTLPSLLNTAGIMLPVIFFNKFFGSRLTGNLDLTRQVLAVPLSFLSISISQVYLQRWSEKFNNKQSIIRDFKYLIVFLAGVSLLMLVFIYFFGQWLFPFVFGQKWDLAGKFSEILIFKYSLTFIVSPLTVIFIALKKIKYSSTWQIFYFLIIASLMFFKHLKADAFLTVYVMFDVFSYVLYFVLIWYILIKYEKSLKNAKL